MRRRKLYGVVCTFALLGAGSAFGQQRDEGDRCARSELKKMTDFLARQRSFTVNSERSSDVVVQGKAQTLRSRGRIALQRPDKLRVDREGDLGTGSAWYDGRQFSVMQKGTHTYATTKAPPTIDELMDQAEEAIGWVPPGADLLSSDPGEALRSGAVSAGRCLSHTKIDGTPVTVVAFDGLDARWQISIEDSATPLPRELVIAPKDDPEVKRQTVKLSGWQLNPKLDPQLFTFTPPKDAERVAFLAAKQPPEKRHVPGQGRRGVER